MAEESTDGSGSAGGGSELRQSVLDAPPSDAGGGDGSLSAAADGLGTETEE